ncbi:unnamed protein product [Ectocarpus sp. 6 AP-2014]
MDRCPRNSSAAIIWRKFSTIYLPVAGGLPRLFRRLGRAMVAGASDDKGKSQFALAEIRR